MAAKYVPAYSNEQKGDFRETKVMQRPAMKPVVSARGRPMRSRLTRSRRGGPAMLRSFFAHNRGRRHFDTTPRLSRTQHLTGLNCVNRTGYVVGGPIAFWRLQ